MKQKLEKPTLLLLSKQLDIRRWVRRISQDDFYLIEETNPTSAIETSRNTEISFILVDALIDPEIFELCQQILQSHLENTPLLLISGKLHKSFRDQAIKIGVSEIILPFSDRIDFLEKIELVQKALETKEKIASLSLKFKKTTPTPPSTSSLKQKLIWSEPILKEAKRLAQEKAFLMLIIEIDHFSSFEKETQEETSSICQQEWRKIFSEKQTLFSLGDGKFLSLFAEMSSKELEKNARNFQRYAQAHALSSSKNTSFTLSVFVSSIKEKELLKNEQITAFFDQMLLKADEKLQELKGVGQFFVDLQG